MAEAGNRWNEPGSSCSIESKDALGGNNPMLVVYQGTQKPTERAPNAKIGKISETT